MISANRAPTGWMSHLSGLSPMFGSGASFEFTQFRGRIRHLTNGLSEGTEKQSHVIAAPRALIHVRDNDSGAGLTTKSGEFR